MCSVIMGANAHTAHMLPLPMLSICSSSSTGVIMHTCSRLWCACQHHVRDLLMFGSANAITQGSSVEEVLRGGGQEVNAECCTLYLRC